MCRFLNNNLLTGEVPNWALNNKKPVWVDNDAINPVFLFGYHVIRTLIEFSEISCVPSYKKYVNLHFSAIRNCITHTMENLFQGFVLQQFYVVSFRRVSFRWLPTTEAKPVSIILLIICFLFPICLVLLIILLQNSTGT
jgi:hypothetical protein